MNQYVVVFEKYCATLHPMHNTPNLFFKVSQDSSPPHLSETRHSVTSVDCQ